MEPFAIIYGACMKTSILIFLLLFCCSSVVQTEQVPKLCHYGNKLIPEQLYSHLIGWNCFEHVGYPNDVIIHVCITAEGYRVPCVQNKGIYYNFNALPTKEKLLQLVSKEEKFEYLMTCYNERFDCDNQPDAGSDVTSKVWIPGDIGVCNTETRNKVHIALLSFSLIIGFPAVLILFYFTWRKNSALLILHRNLITALTFRSFFTLLVQSEIILPIAEGSNSVNGSGVPALASFETFFLDLVLGFWLVFTIFIWKIIKDEYKITPGFNIYNYIILGVSFLFTLIWIIVMACVKEDYISWLGVRSWDQWINDPIRIIFLLVQIVLIGDSVKRVVTQRDTFGNGGGDLGRRVRRDGLLTFLLTPLFILQFAMTVGTPNGPQCEEAFFYTLYFIDGLQAAVVAILFFYIDSEVHSQLSEMFGLGEYVLPAKPVSTLDSLRDRSNGTGQDVVYSSVVTPERYVNTLNLYQKLNVAPQRSVTLVDGEQFITCQDENEKQNNLFVKKVSPKKSVTEIDGEQFLTCSSDAVRKMSTISEFFDAQSFTEFHDTIDNELKMEEIVYERKENDEKLDASFHNITNITPIYDSRYSTIHVSVTSSSISSQDVPDTLKEEKRRDSTSSSTSAESVKNFPMATPVNEQEMKNLLLVSEKKSARLSTLALKGSSSEESINIDHHDIAPTPYFPENGEETKEFVKEENKDLNAEAKKEMSNKDNNHETGSPLKSPKHKVRRRRKIALNQFLRNDSSLAGSSSSEDERKIKVKDKSEIPQVIDKDLGKNSEKNQGVNFIRISSGNSSSSLEQEESEFEEVDLTEKANDNREDERKGNTIELADESTPKENVGNESNDLKRKIPKIVLQQPSESIDKDILERKGKSFSSSSDENEHDIDEKAEEKALKQKKKPIIIFQDLSYEILIKAEPAVVYSSSSEEETIEKSEEKPEEYSSSSKEVTAEKTEEQPVINSFCTEEERMEKARDQPEVDSSSSDEERGEIARNQPEVDSSSSDEERVEIERNQPEVDSSRSEEETEEKSEEQVEGLSFSVGEKLEAEIPEKRTTQKKLSPKPSLRKPQTSLDDISEHTGPRTSITTQKRNKFSKMFSNHRDNVLKKRKEDSNRKSTDSSLDNSKESFLSKSAPSFYDDFTHVEFNPLYSGSAILSNDVGLKESHPSSSLKDTEDFELVGAKERDISKSVPNVFEDESKGIPLCEGSENLTSEEQLKKTYRKPSLSSSESSDRTAISSDEFEKGTQTNRPIPAARQVFQKLEEWNPQEVHFA